MIKNKEPNIFSFIFKNRVLIQKSGNYTKRNTTFLYLTIVAQTKNSTCEAVILP